MILCGFFSVAFSSTKLSSLPVKVASVNNNFHLGTLNIETSTKSIEAKKHIELGMKFLHAFMYDFAQEEFLKAQALDRQSAMAYYGELMSQKHMLWKFENSSNAHAIINKSKQHLVMDKLLPVERALLQSSYFFFEVNTLPQKRFNNAISFLTKEIKRLPHDIELDLALLLLKLGYVSEFPNSPLVMKYLEQGRKKIENIFKKYPKHPGVIHYHLHYFDSEDKNIAVKAKNTANAASILLYSSSHLTHMSAHIYRRLGLWKAFLAANQRSVEASDKICAYSVKTVGKRREKDLISCDADNRYHGLEWLHFGALKINNIKVAKLALSRMQHDALLAGSDELYGVFYRMWARQVLSSRVINTPIIKLKKITKQNNNMYWMAYSECGALLANGVLKAQKKQSIKSELFRLKIVSQKAASLTDPFVYHSCQLNRTLLLAVQAKGAGLSDEKDKWIARAMKLEKKLISTEATPSLNFIDLNTFILKLLGTAHLKGV